VTKIIGQETTKEYIDRRIEESRVIFYTKFSERSIVRHIKTGKEYRIFIGPEKCRIENGSVPAYVYHDVEYSVLWVLPQVEMEDGRFEAVKNAWA